MNQKKFILVLMCVFVVCGFDAYAQKADNGVLWRKIVAREVAIGEKDNAPHKKSKVSTELTLTETIVNAVKARKLTAFANTDNSFSKLLSVDDLNEMVATRYDKVLIVDPITGKEKNKTIDRSFKYEGVLTYRVLESWTFNPVTCKTEIAITGIAPIRNVYDSYGVMLGVQAMFWLHYEDVRPILERYEKTHPEQSIRGLIWNDYFSTVKKTRVRDSVWECLATRTIEMPLEKEDTIVRRLKDQARVDESSLFDVLYNAKYAGKLKSYLKYDHGFINLLSAKDICDNNLIKTDTQVITDPVTNTEITKVIKSSANMSYNGKMKIMENWSFNTAAGITDINMVGIAPMGQIPWDKESIKRIPALFWVKYEDVRELVTEYDEYHPGNSFAVHIWDNYFLSEEKPVVER